MMGLVMKVPLEALPPGAAVARMREIVRLMREADQARIEADSDAEKFAAAQNWKALGEKVVWLVTSLEAQGCLRECEDFLTVTYGG